ncbi:carboxypeptidase regulatory-like domain-containing protein [Couchioplanes azureus]|uniref:carboxypeptidase regulatory-like domain-containing protein n=1 Tax=Couchioplanes caeruleus TaxID=56438 RepID=UPI001671010A|nr:carboxypeptidase regulatory-like domain-containing protein [Couchioplanes caeruleus]GGQ82608.1 hypothetical protein GCM10010166_60980 [Couchioplanes caeruleus subsp. azureus]
MIRPLCIALVAATALLTGACGSGDDSGEAPYQPPVRSERTGVVPRNQPQEEPAEPAANGAVRVHGRVVYAGSGEPYGGAWVEFTTVFDENVHTTTDSNGYYSLPVPPGVYTALAGDEPDADLEFSVSNLAGNTVSIPPDNVVNFVVTPTG